MTRPWHTVDRAETPEGTLELRRRGEPTAANAASAANTEYVITVGGRVLMNGGAHQTEDAVAVVACRPYAGQGGAGRAVQPPRVLIGGLGMGYTLRAALDLLPRAARVLVAEIDPVIVRWCRGPLAPLTAGAVLDPRVTVEIADVSAVLRRAARGLEPAFDAIILDLYEGPREAHGGKDDPLWGEQALLAARAALAPGGILAVWSEDPDAAFERRLKAVGFTAERHRPGKGGPRHVVYVARRRAPR